MKTENGIPIFDTPKTDEDRETLYSKIALNALKTMTDELVKMENSGLGSKLMMDKCVWPILHEAGRRFAKIEEGENSEEGNFDSVVKK